MPDMELFGYPWYVYSIEQCATSVILEPGMTHIGEYAFLEFTKMTECILPNTVTSIGMAAFGACRSMPAFDLPDSITVIGLSAFDNCESLTSFTIPPQVTLLDYDTFMYCTNLQTVILPEGLTTIRPGAFRECISLADVKIPASVTFIEEGAFPAFDQAYIRCVAGSYAHDYAVRNSVAIKELIDPGFSSDMTLPSALKTIEAEAFSGIAAAGVTVPDGTTSIGSKAFANCPNLKMIRIPASVKTIAADAFEGDGIILIYGARNSAAETFAATSDYLCFFEAQ